MALQDIDIQPLTPQRPPDFLDVFEQRAFTDKPKWLSCCCQFPPADHKTVVWKERTAAPNRAATCARIGQETMTGWLACPDDQAIGWRNAGPRKRLTADR